MANYKVNMTYEPFSQEPEYIEANRTFVQSFDLASSSIILDLACGIGTMADLLLERRTGVSIIGMDLSLESLLLAQDHSFRKENNPHFDGKPYCLVQATADCLPARDQIFDFVIMGNSIHLLPDFNRLIGEINRVLRPGGMFAFNSSFYAGTMPKGTEKFHHEWMKLALAYIIQKDMDLCKQGLAGIKRKRGTVPGAFTARWPSPEEWTSILEQNNFRVINLNERIVPMNQQNFEKIGAYGGFAKIILSGYPVEEASEALQETAGPALRSVAMDIVPRNWLEVIAVKKEH